MTTQTLRCAAMLAWLGALQLAGCTRPVSGKECLEGLAVCGGACVDLASDQDHCGSCDGACAAGETCITGVCTRGCAPPLLTCGTGAAVACVDAASDVQNCGACGNACAAGESCTLGVCHLGCAADGWKACGERCYQVASDPSHCGDCGTTCASGQTCSAGACVTSGSVSPPRLIVSITADDTFADQFTDMAPALEAVGLRATFFVSAGRIDVPGVGYLTTPQLAAMQAVGHEIGSHGLTHQHLTAALNLPERISREVCDSRADLLGRGFDVRSFAYPFGEVDGLAQAEVQRCGYAMGRLVGALSSSAGIYADTRPAADPFNLRASSSVNSSQSLEQVQQLVLNAEAHATGALPSWLVINFHHICPGAACNPALGWDTGSFRQLTAWLAARAAQGTVVRTLAQVANVAVAPAVTSGTPLFLNGGFESSLAGADQAPDCWSYGGSGTSAYSWSRMPGRSGFAQQLFISSYSSGSRCMLQYRGSTHNPDFRSCGTPVTPGHTYAFTCWYRSDVPVAFTFYRNDSTTHLTSSWMLSPSSPPSPNAWAQKTFEGTIPAGFNTVFFGPYVSSVCSSGCLGGDGTATLQVDDCSVVDLDQ